MQPIEPADLRTNETNDLAAARLAFGAVLAQAFIAEGDARRTAATPPPAPRAPQLNRHQRRQQAALARKR